MNKQRKKNHPSISLCMIVKNEEEFLGECLESVKNVVDQIVVLDTGSTDKTVEIAESFGAEIHHFKWCDDFSAARNESIKYATGNWIFWIDADERLDPESITKLKKSVQLKNPKIIYRVIIRSSKENGEVFHDSDAHRLFPNGLGIQFENRVHEQISFSAARLGIKEIITDIRLFHMGYDLDEEDTEKKRLRNLPLLEKLVEENPNQAYAHYTLGQNYSQGHENEKALKHFLIAYSSKQLGKTMDASACNVIAQSYSNLGDWDTCKEYALKSLDLIPMQSGALYMLFKHAEHWEKYEEGINYLKKMLKNTRYLLTHPKTLSTDTLLPIPKILGTIALFYLKLEDKKTALHYYIEMWNESENEKTLKKIIEVAKEISEWKIMSDYLKVYLEKVGSTEEALDMLGLSLIKQGKMEEALDIYLELNKLQPNEVTVIRRIASLYAKLGDMDNAQAWVMLMNQMESESG